MGQAVCSRCKTPTSEFAVRCNHCGNKLDGSKNAARKLMADEVKVQGEYKEEYIKRYLPKAKVIVPRSAVVLYALSLSSVVMAFYKLLSYTNLDSGSYVNAYEGSYAYNNIINSNYFIGFNVLALVLALIASTIVICKTMVALKSSQ